MAKLTPEEAGITLPLDVVEKIIWMAEELEDVDERVRPYWDALALAKREVAQIKEMLS